VGYNINAINRFKRAVDNSIVLILAMLDKGPAYKILIGDLIKGRTVIRLKRGFLALRLSLNGPKASGGILE